MAVIHGARVGYTDDSELDRQREVARRFTPKPTICEMCHKPDRSGKKIKKSIYAQGSEYILCDGCHEIALRSYAESKIPLRMLINL